jgi:hypothetical protein
MVTTMVNAPALRPIRISSLGSSPITAKSAGATPVSSAAISTPATEGLPNTEALVSVPFSTAAAMAPEMPSIRPLAAARWGATEPAQGVAPSRTACTTASSSEAPKSRM